MKTLIFALGFFFVSLTGFATSSDQTQTRALVHIMDYLSTDYAGAVDKGKIINKEEYQEQVDFINEAIDLAKKIPELKKDVHIAGLLTSLKSIIVAKRSASEVFAVAQNVKKKIINVTGLTIAPTRWPDAKIGKVLFEQNCVSCHGATGLGDGPAGTALNPPPSNLLDPSRMPHISPFQVFNTVRLGVKGTAMPSFDYLSEQDIWALSFYVSSLRFQDKADSITAAAIDNGLVRASLADVATMSDVELRKKLDLSEDENTKTLAALRLFNTKDDGTHTLRKARRDLNEALEAYKLGDLRRAKDKAIMSYLEGVEPIEPRLRTQAPEYVTEIETQMSDLRRLIDTQASPVQVEAAVVSLNTTLLKVADFVKKAPLSPTLTFIVSASILLREGFEALLIVVALLSVISISRDRKAAYFVHGGWMAAVFVGALAWIFSGWVLSAIGSKIEFLEGVTSLFAVVILLYMGFWLHSKTEMTKWKAFIDERVDKALKTRNLVAIGGMSFVAVFREALETVLFLRSIWIEGGAETRSFMLMGVVSATIILFGLSWLLLRYATRIPIRQLFEVSSVLMVVLSVVLAGKGLQALQENGTVSMTMIGVPFKFELLGIYPTVETLAAQLFVLIFSGFLWFAAKRPIKSHPIAG